MPSTFTAINYNFPINGENGGEARLVQQENIFRDELRAMELRPRLIHSPTLTAVILRSAQYRGFN